MGGTELTMKRAVTVITILAATTSRGFAAPQFLTETIRSNCRSEVTTVFEETETEAVNKVICQTEFRDECVKNIENVCRNVSSVVEKIPTKISKKVTKVVCAEDTEEENKTEAPESDNSNNIINDIFEIFGVSNSNVNEVSET